MGDALELARQQLGLSEGLPSRQHRAGPNITLSIAKKRHPQLKKGSPSTFLQAPKPLRGQLEPPFAPILQICHDDSESLGSPLPRGPAGSAMASLYRNQTSNHLHS